MKTFKRLMFAVVALSVGGTIGGISAAYGYNVLTWQYWAFAAPFSIITGAIATDLWYRWKLNE